MPFKSMTEILVAKGTARDFSFFVKLLSNRLNLIQDHKLRKLESSYRQAKDNLKTQNKTNLAKQIEYEVRYAASSEMAYFMRYVRRTITGKGQPGVTLREIVSDVSAYLGQGKKSGTLEGCLTQLFTTYMDKYWKQLSEGERLQVIREAGLQKASGHRELLKGIGASGSLLSHLATHFTSGTAAAVVGSAVAGSATGTATGSLIGKCVACKIAGAVFSVPLLLYAQTEAYRITSPAMLYLGGMLLR
jgi:hypothetical protein